MLAMFIGLLIVFAITFFSWWIVETLWPKEEEIKNNTEDSGVMRVQGVPPRHILMKSPEFREWLTSESNPLRRDEPPCVGC